MDTFYHTGFYRFVSCGEFKIDGIPCLTQKGEKEMVFFTETNLVGNKNVVPVKKHYAYYKIVIMFLIKKIKSIVSDLKYHFAYLQVNRSVFKGLKLEFYFGDIVKGVPYFFPRRLVKLTKKECEEYLQEDIEKFKKTDSVFAKNLVATRTWEYYKSMSKFIPIKYFGFNCTSLGWKMKYDDPRFEWPPMYSFVIFGKQLHITVRPNISVDDINEFAHIEDVYWETWLNYKYHTDKTKTEHERLFELMQKYSNVYSVYLNGEFCEIDYYAIILK